MESMNIDFQAAKGLTQFIPDGPPAYNPYFTTTAGGHPAYFNQLAINCYSYALNILGHGWGIPGRLKDEEESELHGGDFDSGYIQQQILKDGCQQVAPHGCSPDEHIFAFTMSADNYFHFTVRQKDGFFAGKQGQGRIEIIRSDMPDFHPGKAVSKRYNRFIGFYMVPRTGISYYLREPASSEPYDLFI